MSQGFDIVISAEQIEEALFRRRLIGVVREGRLAIIAPASRFGQSLSGGVATPMQAAEAPRELDLSEHEGQAVLVAYQTGTAQLWGAQITGTVDPAIACVLLRNRPKDAKRFE